MGSKPSFSEVDPYSSRPPAFDQAGPARKKPRNNKKPVAKLDSKSWIKKRARTIERRLRKGKDSLPAHVQQDLERELSALNHQIMEGDGKKERSKMIKKYHMLRFFERKKAMRLEKQLRKRLAETQDPGERAAIEADLHIAEVDKMYAMYFPFMEPYVSLYPKSDSSDPSARGEGQAEEKPEKPETQSSAALALHSPRPPLWVTVEETMKEGQQALERLRDREPPRASRSSRKPSSGQSAAAGEEEQHAGPGSRPRKESRSESGDRGEQGGNDDDSDSDSEGGGFFEED